MYVSHMLSVTAMIFFRKTAASQVGIPAMAAHYGIRNDEILVFGDGRTTWTCCATSVSALRWATGCVKAKAAANYVTTNVDDDGIYRALKELGVI